MHTNTITAHLKVNFFLYNCHYYLYFSNLFFYSVIIIIILLYPFWFLFPSCSFCYFLPSFLWSKFALPIRIQKAILRDNKPKAKLFSLFLYTNGRGKKGVKREVMNRLGWKKSVCTWTRCLLSGITVSYG
jgi:hypothetical protein